MIDSHWVKIKEKIGTPGNFTRENLGMWVKPMSYNYHIWYYHGIGFLCISFKKLRKKTLKMLLSCKV